MSDKNAGRMARPGSPRRRPVMAVLPTVPGQPPSTDDVHRRLFFRRRTDAAELRLANLARALAHETDAESAQADATLARILGGGTWLGGPTPHPHTTLQGNSTRRAPRTATIDRPRTGGATGFPGRSDAPSPPPVADWEPRYRRAVILSDVFSTLLTVAVVGGLVGAHTGLTVGKIAVLGMVTAAVVLCSLGLNRVWNLQVLGQGAEEYGRLGRGLFAADVVLGLAGLAFSVTTMRPWVFLVVPAIAVLAYPLRYGMRKLLHRARNDGRCLLPVLAAGSVDTVRDLIERTRISVHIGWRVDAVCTADGIGNAAGELDGIPVIGVLDNLADHVRRGGYRIVAITADPSWTPKRLQQLAWKLEGSGADMVVAPTLMEVAGPRLHVSGVLGMPLLRVSAPAFTGGRRVVKDIFDRIGAALLLVLLAPMLITISLVVLIDSRGPVFYKQRRVGKDGREFTIVKFRTMVSNADRMLTDLSDLNEGAGLLFKMRRDPRVTRVGSVLRRYSIDELPQLFNVLTGSMSLVGPRPPLPEETAKYGEDVRRRLLVKPGVTGLWQVSGRSDLSWEEAIRLDLRYVEDWSLALDATILWKTFRAVLSGQGAY